MDLVWVTGRDDETVMARRDGFGSVSAEAPAFGDGLEVFKAWAHDKSATNPVPEAGWVWLDNQLYAVAVGAIIPSDPSWAETMGKRRGTGVLAQSLQTILVHGVARTHSAGALCLAARRLERSLRSLRARR